MTVVYVPISRVSVSYTVKRGRRWTLLEHLLLLELSAGSAKASDLAYSSRMPTRLVVEALINLLRAGWIEVRATDDATLFAATATGRTVAVQEELPAALTVHARRTSLCYDRLVGTFMKSDEIDLIHENKLSFDAIRLEPRTFTVPGQDGELVERLYYDPEETFEDWRGYIGVSSRFYARVEVTAHEINGLPGYAPEALRLEIVEQAGPHLTSSFDAGEPGGGRRNGGASRVLVTTVQSKDIVVGGTEHRDLLQDVLRKAASMVCIHSCFLREDAVARLLPDIQRAAERGVRVDLLWGVARDETLNGALHPIEKVRQVLAGLSAKAKRKVILGAASTGSHAKLLLHDADGCFEAVVGSCNWLSTDYGHVEISIRSRHPMLAARIAQILAGLQMPSSGPWTSSTRRLLETWRALGKLPEPTSGTHELSMVLDDEHYGVVRRARDLAHRSLAVGCDLFGFSADTSVLVPAATAAEAGVQVVVAYARLSDRLREDGHGPDRAVLAAKGIDLVDAPKLHGKFLAFDEHDITITSFNWLSTTVDPSKPRFGEVGLSAKGEGLAGMLLDKLTKAGVTLTRSSTNRECNRQEQVPARLGHEITKAVMESDVGER